MFAKKSISRIFSVLFVIIFILAVLPLNAVHAAGIFYAKPAASGTGDCSSWTNACTLQTALIGASSGDEIWVMAGTHKPTTGTDRTATFPGKNGLAVYGGFAGAETARTQRDPAVNVTILSGDIDNNDSQTPIITDLTTVTGNTTNSYHVVAGTTGAILDGFTITAGYADGGGCPGESCGGGMYNYSSSPTLSNITFRGNSASDGGGMENWDSSSPALTNVTFSGNSAGVAGGGMYNRSGSTPTLTDVTFNGNSATDGGGMYNSSSSPTLTNVTFSGNTATSWGGGMYNDHSIPILTNVTFNGNSATDSGGGMINDSSSPTLAKVTFSDNSVETSGGGMINLNGSSPSLTNVTFSGNSAYSGGGMSNDSSSPMLTNVTFFGNSATGIGSYHEGGGMYNYGSNPTIRNAIFWGNTASSDGAQIHNDSSTPSISDSVVQDGYAGGTNIITADPVLGTLGDYGGFTRTIPLLAGSSAIDTGNPLTCATTDQRGVARPQGAHCDVGAFEAVQQALVVNSVADTDDGLCDVTDCTLREAINTANASAPGVVTTITFSTGSVPTITLGSTLPAVSSNLVIQGPGSGHQWIDGDNHYRVLIVNSGASLALSNVSIANGYPSSGNGGGIDLAAGGTLSVTDCLIGNNVVPGSGGGIHNGGGSLTVTRVTFYLNQANYGGAIDSGEGSLSVTDSTFDRNTVTDGGGAINNYHSTSHAVLITNSSFHNNSAVHGGAIRNDHEGTLNITNSTFSANTASEAGGVNNYIGTTNIANSTFSDNGATDGGSLSNSTGTLNVTNSTLSSSSASSSANLRNYSGTTTLRNSILASSGGSNCQNGGTLTADAHNLVSDASCGVSVTQTSLANLKLGALANNGGSTQTIALLAGSAAIDAGDNAVCAAAPVNNQSQNGITRPKDGNGDNIAVCDAGSYEAPDTFFPHVLSITRASTNPTHAASVNFTVTFSESVTGVDKTDFTLTTTGLTGASVTSVSGSGATRTVVVNTGSGSGTLKLNVTDNDSIVDVLSNPLGGAGTGNGNFTSGQVYTLKRTLTYTSTGAYDGYILESSETSNAGGSMNASATTFILGDDSHNRQYRAILSFNTASLPDTAVIKTAVLKIKHSGSPAGTNPFTVLGTLYADIRKGFFGTSIALQLTDFNTTATATKVAAFGKTPASGWYSATLNTAGRLKINKTGLTQFRLYFNKDDNNNHVADFMKFISGNYSGSTNRPQLIITYTIP